MRKVPLIQAQAEQYHKIEAQNADLLLNQLGTFSGDKTPLPDVQPHTLSWFQKIKKYLFG